MKSSGMRCEVSPVLLALVVGSCAGLASAQDINWNNGGGGAWDLPANWLENDEPDTVTENAVIAIPGPYVVTLNASRTILDLRFTSAGSTLALTGAALSMNGTHLQEGSTITGAAGATVSVLGLTTFRNATLTDLATFTAAGSLLFDGPGDTSILNTSLNHTGASGTWQGAGDLLFGGGATPTGLSLSAASTFTITNDRNALWNNSGTRPDVVNAGTLDKNGGTGTTGFLGVRLNNSGTVRASTGTLAFDQVANITGATLTGGTWRVDNNASLDLVGQSITSNQATIELNGANSSFGAINSLQSNDAAGTLRLLGGRTFAAQGSLSNAGQIELDIGSSVRVTPGNTFTSVNGTISGANETSVLLSEGNAVFQGGTLSSLSLMSTGSLRFTGTNPVFIEETCIDHSGLGCTWDGTGGITLTGGTTFGLGASTTATFSNQQTMTWDNTGVRPSLDIAGTLIRTTGATTTDITGVQFNNTGTVRVEGGTLRADTVEQVQGTTLTSGTWDIRNNSTLDFAAQTITTNLATVSLDGAGATFNAINPLQTNDTGGSLTVSNGKNFTTAGTFTNNGTVGVVGDTGPALFKVATGSTLTNYNPATRRITGGLFNVRGSGRDSGTIEIDGLDIAELDAAISLDGAGASIIDPVAAADALRNLELIDNAGDFSILNSKNFTTLADLTVAPTGKLGSGLDSTFTVDGDLTNFDGAGGFNDGEFTIGGTLRADNASIVTLANILTMDGPARIERPDGGGGFIDALASLETIAPTGRLTIRNGHQLTLLPHDLASGAGSTLTVGPAIDTVGDTFLHVQGNFNHAGTLHLIDGLVTVDSDFVNDGAITGTGLIEAPAGQFLFNNGQMNPGNDSDNGVLSMDGGGDLRMNDTGIFTIDLASAGPGVGHDQIDIGGRLVFTNLLAGRLEVLLDPAFVAIPGEQFEILRFDGGAEGWFEEVIVSDIFLQIRESDRFVLQVVPTPGAGAVIVLAGLLAVRRRRA